MSINLEQYNNRKPGRPIKEDQSPNSVVALLNKDIQLFQQGMSMKKKEAFFSEFGILLQSGLDFKTALELVIQGQKGKQLSLYEGIRDNIIKGASFSDALQASGKFQPYDVFSVKIAEESGKMESVLEELASFYGKNIQHQRLLMSALSYPILVVVTSVVALGFLLNFLVPMFSDVYKRLNQELPLLTQLVVKMSYGFSKYFLVSLLSIFVVVITMFINRKKAWARRLLSGFLTRIPLFGKIISLTYLNRFCLTMSFLTSSKVPVLEALKLVERMIGFYPLEVAIRDLHASILKGSSLHEAMRRHKVFPRRMIAIIQVGEEVNHLEQMFGKLAKQYNEEAEYKIKAIGGLIEPVMIVFLAFVVGIILVAMYLPIFKLVTNFGV